ncbi:MAG: glucodextranase DOMON-like domain-containing protein [Elusimicrobiales bacterium]
MKKNSFSLALAAALFIGSVPSSAQQAYLWVPSGEAGLEEVTAALEADTALRLTAAFSSLPKSLAPRLKTLEAEGRLELALRPAGDPPLPLLYYPGAGEVKWENKPSTAAMQSAPYFLSLRLSRARDAALKDLGKAPAGLVSPPGGLTADYFPLARALGVSWIACGPLASTAAAVMQAGGVYAVPFVPYSTTAANGPFVIFDETAAPDPAALRALLAAELKSLVPQARLTVSDALKTAVSTAAEPGEIAAAASPWAGDYSRFASARLQAGALSALARTRADLMLHLNAAQGDYRKAAPAFEEYFSAEDGTTLLALASAEPEAASEAETGLRSSLANAYRLMNKQPPSWAFSSLTDADSDAGAGAAGKLAVEKLPGGFLITNSDRPAAPPAATPGLPSSADAASIWKLTALKVTNGRDGTLFQFKPAALDNAHNNASGFSHLRLDLYMDVNHRPRAGATRPLEGRPFRLFPENAWEYALEITPAGAALHKLTPRGPAKTANLRVTSEQGWIKVLVPPAAMRGTPAFWSYAALLLAPAGNEYAITDYIAEDVANGYIYAVRPGKL